MAARDVIGAAIAVHQELGPGYREAIYEEALALELAARRIPFGRQVPITVSYRGQAQSLSSPYPFVF